MFIRFLRAHRLVTFGAAAAVAAVVSGASLHSATLSQDLGADGLWQQLLKLQTTASVMHTTAHPDDEHGGALALLSRRDGARLSLLTLNRGESGDNAIGPQLFDGLGLIRTEELRVSDRYYGVDNQYFTTVLDYGFSKRIEEAFEKWGRDVVMRDVVRLIRMDRPYVLLSRFQGNQRDGHGNHQTAGLITTLAFKAAGDPNMYPEQIREGLRPWQPHKVYIGGVRENEAWNVKIDAGEFSPWIGDSYSNFARLGLSFQRSQVSGRYNPQAGPQVGYYTRVDSVVGGAEKEASIFDGIDTTIPGLFKALRKPEPAGAAPLLAAIDAAVKKAVAAFSVTNPSATVPALAQGLKATRDALAGLSADPDAVFVLKVKEEQFQDAINTALGIDVAAAAQPAGVPEPTGPMAGFMPPPAMAAPVPGQSFEVRMRVTNRGNVQITPVELSLDTDKGWNVQKGQAAIGPLGYNASASQRFTVTLAQDVPLSSRAYFSRSSVTDTKYTLSDPAQFGRPASTPPAIAVFTYTVDGVQRRGARGRGAPRAQAALRRREPRAARRPGARCQRVAGPAQSSRSAPRPSRSTSPSTSSTTTRAPSAGSLALTLPASWTSQPASQPFSFTRAGERATYRFTVNVPALENKAYTIEAVATANGRQYREGYEMIDHRDLEVRYLYRAATVDVHGLDVKIVPSLNVGYVMGVGDQVPAGIRATRRTR